MEMQFSHDSSAFLNSIEFIDNNENIRKYRLSISFNNREYIIHAALKKLDDIRLISYDEFHILTTVFVNMKNRNQCLDTLFRVIWDYAENKKSVIFPVKII